MMNITRRCVACSSVLVILASLLGSCDRSPTDTPTDSREVNVLSWSEYIDPAIVTNFEKETGLRVRIDVYDDTESMIAKMQHQDGDRLYDVVIASDHAIPVLRSLKLIRPIEFSQVPNATNIDERFRSPGYDPDGSHSLPYQWGTVGLMYRKPLPEGRDLSWDLVLGERTAGRFVLIDSMRDMMGAALKIGGNSVNTTDPQALRSAADLIVASKNRESCFGFEGGVGGKNKVASGIADFAIVYSGDALRAVVDDPNLGYGVPKEGSIIFTDAMTITARARNVSGAYAFVNTILDANVGAQLSAWTRYATPNAAAKAHLPTEFVNDPAVFPSEEAMKSMEFLTDVGAATIAYDNAWTDIKTR
jgi:spermidine/putrescine transport system substrate-binding protein